MLNPMLAKIQPKSPVVKDWDEQIILNYDGWALTLKEVYDAIKRNQGRLAHTAIEIDVPLQDLANAANTIEVLGNLVHLYIEQLVDDSEAVVRDAVINKGDPITAMQVLRTKGARRGWHDKLDQQSTGKTLRVVALDDWRGGDEEKVQPASARQLPPAEAEAPSQFMEADIIADSISSSSEERGSDEGE